MIRDYVLELTQIIESNIPESEKKEFNIAIS